MVCPNCGRRTFKREPICPKCGTPMPERKPVEIRESFELLEPTEDNNPVTNYYTEGESDLSLFNRKKQKESTAPAEQPSAPVPEAAVPAPSAPAEFTAPAEPPEQFAPEAFAPAAEIKSADPPVEASVSEESSDLAADLSSNFYGGYGEVCSDTAAPTAVSDAAVEESTEAAKTEVDFSVLDFEFADVTDAAAEESVTAAKSPVSEDSAAAETVSYGAVSSNYDNFDSSDDDDDDSWFQNATSLITSDAEGESQKSKEYDKTVELKNARKSSVIPKTAVQEQSPSDEKTAPKKNKRNKSKKESSKEEMTYGRLPKARNGKVYMPPVSLGTYMRFTGRRFRGLGVLATLCLVIIAAFCIWSYANSFVDPLVGVWKGDVSSANIPIEQIQKLDQDVIASTWEFSSSGSMYLNIVLNQTPVSLSGSYEQKKDDNDEPYLSMTLTNPMDSQDYTMEMYYTVTGNILEFTDMQGMGMTIDLTKE